MPRRGSEINGRRPDLGGWADGPHSAKPSCLPRSFLATLRTKCWPAQPQLAEEGGSPEGSRGWRTPAGLAAMWMPKSPLVGHGRRAA